MIIDADTEAVKSTPSDFSITGAVYISSANGKIFIFYDYYGNKVDIYNSDLTLVSSISGLCVNSSPGGSATSRGYYNDIANNKIYVGETSTTGGIIVIDTQSNTIIKRINLDKEGKSFVGPGVINFHPLRNMIYIGGSVFNDATKDSIAKLWAFDVNTLTVTQTFSPSANIGISGIIHYIPNNSVYISSAGLVPESAPNAGQETDGIIFKFN
ncbi:hypothetical protein [Pedobacter sp. NJ-S-72]